MLILLFMGMSLIKNAKKKGANCRALRDTGQDWEFRTILTVHLDFEWPIQ
jgi:hypothetical protein